MQAQKKSKHWKWNSCTSDSEFQKPEKKAMGYYTAHNHFKLLEEFAEYCLHDP